MSYCLRPHRWENSQKNHIGIKFGVNTELFNGSLPKTKHQNQTMRAIEELIQFKQIFVELFGTQNFRKPNKCISQSEILYLMALISKVNQIC